MDNYRQLLQELMDAVDSGIPVDRIRNSPLAVRIDSALEQPEPAPAPAGEVIQAYQAGRRDAEADARQAAEAAEDGPAGEVGELVAWIHREGVDSGYADQWLRAADLLEQSQTALVPVCERDLDSILSPSGGYELREGAALTEGAQLIGGEWWAPVFGCDSVEHTLNRIRQRLDPFQQNGKLKNYQALELFSVPVAVSERLPGVEDCDAEGKCWWFNPGQPAMSNPHIATSSWRLCRMLNGKPMGSRWIPANSLPLPSGEVQP